MLKYPEDWCQVFLKVKTSQEKKKDSGKNKSANLFFVDMPDKK